jgi:hypothetical protein
MTTLQENIRRIITIPIISLAIARAANAQEFGSWDVPVPDPERWWAPVSGFEPVEPGEHPRILFREKDLPWLRSKMNKPEGEVLPSRLRELLNGGDGRSMPLFFNPADSAYTNGHYEQLVLDSAGVYTFGHVVGYGLLFQLTGDTLYADLGRQCFELALEGQRDRDDRYSWVDPGGALRAGPVLGWMSVGYDLCYNGWDEATRIRLGRAIEHYSTDIISKWGGGLRVDLASLTSGTMPPTSNHYSMQVGGAALALLTIHREPWADQKRIDSLLQVSQRSMVHNANQGFGDGGYFAEGDGTGSMATYIAYLTALQGWKNTLGKDFGGAPPPNVRMMALKWLYLTYMEDGKPAIWPVRGGYPHNAWSRGGLSGAGYFGLAFGVLPAEYAAALQWFYERYIKEADRKAGMLYEPTAYPHIVAATFVNWPDTLDARNPSEVLPHCYQDSHYGFYAWRNRWKDNDDIIITALTQSAHGFMGAKADTAFQIRAFGQNFSWGAIPGAVALWGRSQNGRRSVLRFKEGQSVAIGFPKDAAPEALLVATGRHEGEQVEVKGQTITVKYLSQSPIPKIKVRGNRIKVGAYRLRFRDGILEWLN